MKKINSVILGCGKISDIYLKNLTSGVFASINVIGVSDINKAAREAAAKEYNIEPLELSEVYKRSDIDMIINLTPPTVHYEIIKTALLSGKHVYTEKPICATFEEAEEVCRIAEEKNLYLGAAPDTFLGAAAQTGRWIVDSGMIGTPTSCVCALNRDCALMAEKYPYTAKNGGGIGTDVGIYYMTELVSILGPVDECCGFSTTLNPVRKHFFSSKESFGQDLILESENLVSGCLLFKSGIQGTVHFNSNSTQNEQPHVVIYGTEGLLYLPDPNNFGGEVKVLLKGQTEPVVIPNMFPYWANSRGLGVAECAYSILNERKNRANKDLALHSLEVLLGIIKSGKEKKFIKMTTTCERPAILKRGYLGFDYRESQSEGAIAF